MVGLSAIERSGSPEFGTYPTRIRINKSVELPQKLTFSGMLETGFTVISISSGSNRGRA